MPTSDRLKRERAQVAVDLLATWDAIDASIDDQARIVASMTHCTLAEAKRRLHYARSQGITPDKE